jgi:hypothetical protein
MNIEKYQVIPIKYHGKIKCRRIANDHSLQVLKNSNLIM